MENVLIYKPNLIVKSMQTEKIDLDFFYKELECDCIDIPYVSNELYKRKIDMVIDDEGKLVDKKPTVVIVDKDDKILDVVVGNIAFCSINDEGQSIGLNNEQIEYINSLPKAVIADNDNKYEVLVIKF